MTSNKTVSRPPGGAYLMPPIYVGDAAESRKMSLPVTMPFCTDQASVNFNVVRAPVWVKGSYMNV